MKKITFLGQLFVLFFLSISISYSQTGTMTDQDGNVYKTIIIGNQVWMAENLKVTHYQNGDPIPNITENPEWGKLSTGAYCNHKNNIDNAATYGSLYNWFAVNDSRNLAPEGWHIPTDKEWKQMEIYLGMSTVEAYDKRSRGTDEGSQLAGNAPLWNDEEKLEKNSVFGKSGFSALPGGSRGDNYGVFTYTGISAYFWSSTESDSKEAWCRKLDYKHSNVFRNDVNKRYGFSIRCIKDAPRTSSQQKNGKLIVGVYGNEKKQESYLILEVDGTFCVLEGGNKMNGQYEKTGNSLTVKFENGGGGELKIENDIITGPNGDKFIKE